MESWVSDIGEHPIPELITHQVINNTQKIFSFSWKTVFDRFCNLMLCSQRHVNIDPILERFGTIISFVEGVLNNQHPFFDAFFETFEQRELAFVKIKFDVNLLDLFHVNFNLNRDILRILTFNFTFLNFGW